MNDEQLMGKLRLGCTIYMYSNDISFEHVYITMYITSESFVLLI